MAEQISDNILETQTSDDKAAPPVNLKDSSLYINRELSLLAFNRRVLEEAMDESNPLLERIKFTAILSNNLDEFFMTRISGLWSQVDAGLIDMPADQMSPTEQLDAIRREVVDLMHAQRDNYNQKLLPALEQHGIHILRPDQLTKKQLKAVNKYFKEVIFSVLTPLAVDPGRPFPFISNLSLNMAITLKDAEGHEHFARVKIPTGVLPRMITLRTVMEHFDRDFTGVENTFIFLEDIIAMNLEMLFPGMEILENYMFRVTRDADIEIAEEEAADLLETVETGLRQRPFGQVTRLSVDNKMPDSIRKSLMEYLKIPKSRVYEVPQPLGLSHLWQLYNEADAPALRDGGFVPRRPTILAKGRDIFAAIRERDILLYHPYDSFSPVVELIETAAQDPQVLAIKCTLYRLGNNSPIVQALLDARVKNIQVAALVELKARFDEENNITWARALEAQGVHVIYGFPNLKTHSKILLIVRRESDGIRRYVHLGTGNYNPGTARSYTDLGIFTCREDIGDDASMLFNRLTGYAPNAEYKKLIIAPESLRPTMTHLIEREIEHARAGRPARLVFKMNALVDPKMIRRLYEASMAGVKVDLIVRGMCCLRPGIPGISDNIQVISIVGRFLEHARIFSFLNGGEEEIYIGSADLMQRNLDRRVEITVPIESEGLKIELRDVLLSMQLKDTAKARILLPDGTYVQRQPEPGRQPFNSQQWFIEQTRLPL